VEDGSASQLVQRLRISHEPAITSENVEVKGSPVRQQQRLAPLSFIGLDISVASIAVVDPQARLTLDRHDRKSVIICTLTKRTTGSAVTPT